MSNESESLHSLEERYAEGTVDYVVVKKDLINIYLKSGNYISVRPTIDISSNGILPKFGFDRGFWGKIGGE